MPEATTPESAEEIRLVDHPAFEDIVGKPDKGTDEASNGSTTSLAQTSLRCAKSHTRRPRKHTASTACTSQTRSLTK